MPEKSIENKIERHAYLIAAHKNLWQLEMLLRHLDVEENDLYLHIDIKSKDIDLNYLKDCVSRAGIYFTERIDVQWASWSIVESTYLMLEAAYKNGPYTYYHLISGQDVPLRSIHEINKYYNEHDHNAVYIDIGDEKWIKKAVFLRVCYFERFLGLKDLYKNRIIRKISWPFRRLRYMIKTHEIQYAAGAAWFDVNQYMAGKIIENKEWAKRYFYTFLFPDEAFIHSIIEKLGCRDKCVSARRFVDWRNSETGDGHPNTLQIKDYDLLMEKKKDYFFARKFDEQVDRKIIEKVYESINDGVM